MSMHPRQLGARFPACTSTRAPRPHIPVAYAKCTGTPVQPYAHMGRAYAYRIRMCTPAAHAGPVHRPVRSLRHTGHVHGPDYA